jgi:hypothetical protein
VKKATLGKNKMGSEHYTKFIAKRMCRNSTGLKTCRTIILPVVLYGCETWSFTMREEHGLRVLENRVLKKIFGPRKDEVTGEWIKLHK